MPSGQYGFPRVPAGVRADAQGHRPVVAQADRRRAVVFDHVEPVAPVLESSGFRRSRAPAGTAAGPGPSGGSTAGAPAGDRGASILRLCPATLPKSRLNRP